MRILSFTIVLAILACEPLPSAANFEYLDVDQELPADAQAVNDAAEVAVGVDAKQEDADAIAKDAVAPDTTLDTTLDTTADVVVDPCVALNCNDSNPCTDDSCVGKTCKHLANAAPCNDGNACTTGDSCSVGTCKGSPVDADADGFSPTNCGGKDCDDANSSVNPKSLEVCGNTVDDNCSGQADEGCMGCGDGSCGGDETAQKCPSDCSILVKRLNGACASAGSKSGCGNGYFCVGRSATAGGNICVADFSTWLPIPDSHPASDFTEYASYVTDKLTGLSWVKAPLAKMPWSAALSACNAVIYGNNNDWRLPTRVELLSLTDRTQNNPASSAPGLLWTPGGWTHWTSVPWTQSDHAWFVVFSGSGGGGAWGDATSTALGVRCVRGGAANGTGSATRFAMQDGGITVLDRISGLHWQQGFSNAKISQTAALAWCSANTQALPGVGWRVPTSHELEDLVDSQTDTPPVDPVFVDTPSDYFWSSTPWTSLGYAWVVAFDLGHSFATSTADLHRVRCVR